MDSIRARRSKHVSEKLKTATEGDKKELAKARLDALENDDALPLDTQTADSDEDFQLEDSDDDAGLSLGGGRKKKQRKGAGVQRRTRAGLSETRGPKNFSLLLEEADLESLPEGVPSYITAAVGPSKITAPRPWCSVCGFEAPYTCTRCSSRFCSRKCYAVHSETRCLKFTG